MFTLIICTIVIALLILTAVEIERMLKQKRRLNTSKLLTYIASLDPVRTVKLEANAAGDRWQD